MMRFFRADSQGVLLGAVVPVHFEELVYKKWGFRVSKIPPRPRFFFRAGTFKILTTALKISNDDIIAWHTLPLSATTNSDSR